MAARGFLVRRPRKSSNSGQKSAKTQRRKKTPPWDSSISNLLVYKSTVEELKRRHELHQPIKRDLDIRDDDDDEQLLFGVYPGSDKAMLKTPELNDVRFSVLKDIMNSNEKLQDALTYSDKRLSAVKDMFGDDPKKFRGFPNITSAPPPHKHLQGKLITSPAFMKEVSLGASQLDILSDTVMDETALNDLADLDVYNNNTKESLKGGPGPSVYEKSANTCRQLRDTSEVAHERKPDMSEDITRSSEVATSRLIPPPRATNGQDQSVLPTKQDIVDTSLTHQEVEKHLIYNEKSNWEKYKHDDNCDGSTNIAAKRHQDLPQLLDQHFLFAKMVDNLEKEVKMYEKETGREQCSLPTSTRGKDSFGGFTVSILNAVTKLVGYLRDNETQRKADMTINEELLLGFQEQQILIDALINDVICVREENKKLQNELKAYKNDVHNEIENLKRDLYISAKIPGEYNDVDSLRDQRAQLDSSDHIRETEDPALLQPTGDHNAHKENAHYNNVSRDLFGRLSGEYQKEPKNLKTRDVYQDSRTTGEQNIAVTLNQNNCNQVSSTATSHVLEKGVNDVSTRVYRGAPMAMSKTVEDRQLGSRVCSNPMPSSTLPSLAMASLTKYTSLASPTTETTTYNTVPNFLSTSGATSSLPQYISKDYASPSNTSTYNSYNDVRMPQSVFLGRKHSMSPHRHSSVSNKNVDYEESRKTFTTSGSLVENNSHAEEKAQLNSSRQILSDAESVKKHISLLDNSPAEKDIQALHQTKTSPVVSPVFYDRPPYQEFRPAKNENIVITLPSMWQDAELKPHKGITREGTFTVSRKCNIIDNERQNINQGWFALSSHVAQS